MDSYRVGKELPARYSSVVRQLSTQMWRRYPSIVDPADRDTCIELTFRRVANHEQEHGEARDLPSLFWRIFPEVANSLLRKPQYKLPLQTVDQPILNEAIADRSRAQTIEARIYAAQLLDTLDERVSNILHLRFLEGFSAAETAKKVGLSEANVRQICHRAVEQLKRQQQPKAEKPDD